MLSALILTACNNTDSSVASTTTPPADNPVTVSSDVMEQTTTTPPIIDEPATTTTPSVDDTTTPPSEVDNSTTTSPDGEVSSTLSTLTEEPTATEPTTTSAPITTTTPTTTKITTTEPVVTTTLTTKPVVTTAPATTTTTPTTTAPQPVAKTSGYMPEMEVEILNILNDIRAENGLCTFEQDKNWEIFADRWSKYVAEQTAFKHSGLAYEIIAAVPDYYTAEDIMNGFMNSAGHKRNILDQAGVNTTHCAVSVYHNGLNHYLVTIVLENKTYEDNFKIGNAIYTEEYFKTNGNVSDDVILDGRTLSLEEYIAKYYKPEYNQYYPHLAV